MSYAALVAKEKSVWQAYVDAKTRLRNVERDLNSASIRLVEGAGRVVLYRAVIKKILSEVVVPLDDYRSARDRLAKNGELVAAARRDGARLSVAAAGLRREVEALEFEYGCVCGRFTGFGRLLEIPCADR
jgi:hypothetical protein